MQTSRNVRGLGVKNVGVKVRRRETQKKNLPGREDSQVKSFVGMLFCLPCSIIAKGSH